MWPFESELKKTRSVNPLVFKISSVAAESGPLRSNPNPAYSAQGNTVEDHCIDSQKGNQDGFQIDRTVLEQFFKLLQILL